MGDREMYFAALAHSPRNTGVGALTAWNQDQDLNYPGGEPYWSLSQSLHLYM